MTPEQISHLNRLGDCTLQITQIVAVTARGDETYGGLGREVGRVLPDNFWAYGGHERIRPGDPVSGDPHRFHETPRQARVVFVRNLPEQGLAPTIAPLRQRAEAAEAEAARRVHAETYENVRGNRDAAVARLKALMAVRPVNWDDEVDDPDGYRAWRDAEDLLKRLGEMP